MALYRTLTRWPILVGLGAAVLTACLGGSVLGVVWILGAIGVHLGRWRTRAVAPEDGPERLVSDAWFGAAGAFGGVAAMVGGYALHALFQPLGLPRMEDRLALLMIVLGTSVAAGLAARAGARSLRGEAAAATGATLLALPAVGVLGIVGALSAQWRGAEVLAQDLSADKVIFGVMVPVVGAVGGAALYLVVQAIRGASSSLGAAIAWMARSASLGAALQTAMLLAGIWRTGALSGHSRGAELGLLAAWLWSALAGSIHAAFLPRAPLASAMRRALMWALGCAPLWMGTTLIGAVLDEVRSPTHRGYGPFVAMFVTPIAMVGVVLALGGAVITAGSAWRAARQRPEA